MELIINSDTSDQSSVSKMEDQFPFFAWECITIEFKDRNLDLVIKNE